jgi:class 3 adenylate cyclase/dihydrofolate reductase
LRRIIVSEFVTLDGVIEAPGFEEHRTGRNAWALRSQTPETQEYIGAQYDRVDAFLLGRVTYQIWAAFWPARPEGDLFGRQLNEAQKYVVSSKLRSVDWQNTTILGADWPERVAELKRAPGKDILVSGSADLVRGLIEHGLADELQLMVFPLILGSGKRLFEESLDTSYWRLANTRVFESGVVALTYTAGAEMPTSNFIDEYAWYDEQVRSLQAAQDADRILATVLFTDIVDSSGRAAALGDRRWRQLLDQHDGLARTEIDRWHGRFVKSTGDGVLATFDTPTRALRCAFGLTDALRPLDVGIRAGIHTGELELRGDDVGGIAVHIASRALSEAGTRGARVVVTRTVRDLASGSDLAFSPLGSVGLRGIPGEWELFEATERR